MLKVTEWSIARTNLIGYKNYTNMEATPSMEKYLEENKIYHQFPLSIEEGSFLIWFDKLQKEYTNGKN